MENFSRKALFTMIWPLLADQILNVLIGMIDVVMVSSLGEAAISGVSLIDSLNSLMFQVLFAVAAGGNVVISKCLGAGDERNAAKASAQLLSITFLMMTAVSIVLVIGKRGIFGMLFGAVDADVTENALKYMLYTALSYPAMAIYNASAASFRSTGDTGTPLLCSFVMNFLNMIGNAVGIYILGMGVAGVAIPTLISRIVGAAMLFFLFQTRNKQCRITALSDFHPDLNTMTRIMAIGIPGGIESGVFQFGKLIL